jgi:hypothetical protein
MKSAMDCELHCPSYSDVVTIIENTSTANYDFLRRLVDHIQISRDVLRRAHDSTSLVTLDFVLSQPECKATEGEVPAVAVSEFSRVWRALLENSLNPDAAIETTLTAFNSLFSMLSANADDYKGQIDALLHKSRDALHRLASACDAARSTHQAYAEVGRAVESAHSQNHPQYAELLRRFTQLQGAAVAAHREYNAVRATVTTSFAEYLSDFEHIEETRSSRLARTLREFSAGLETVSARFGELASQIRDGLHFNDDSESKIFEDTNFLKDAAASVRYQAIPVPGEACKFLDMKKFFHAELKAKGKLYMVTADYRGGVDYLDVVKSEIVCAIEDTEPVKKCKSINECVGLLPSSVLKEV